MADTRTIEEQSEVVTALFDHLQDAITDWQKENGGKLTAGDVMTVAMNVLVTAGKYAGDNSRATVLKDTIEAFHAVWDQWESIDAKAKKGLN